METNIELGKYKHFKGLEVEVMAIAKHSETLEQMVVHKELSNNSVWVRPASMFLEEVSLNGKAVKRFTKID